MKKIIKAKCITCGKDFYKKTHNNKFCSLDCQLTERNKRVRLKSQPHIKQKRKQKENYYKNLKSKVCTKCGIEKNIEKFKKDEKHHKYKKTSICKECLQKRHKEYLEKTKYKYKPSKEMKKKRALKARIYKHMNPEKVKAWQKKRVENLRKNNDGSLTKSKLKNIFYEYKKCIYCGCKLTDENKRYDHMDPLSMGGTHGISNIIICCEQCNTTKKDKSFEEWLNEIKHGRKEFVLNIYNNKKLKIAVPRRSKWTIK